MVSRLAPLLSALISLPVSVSRAEVHREMRIFDLRFVCVLQEDTNRLPEPPLLRTPARDMNCGDLSELSEELIKERQPLGSEQVAEVVRALIDPDSWQNDRNVLETNGNLLVVVQTPEVLARVSRFLGLLERSLSRVVAFDAALVPPEALEKAAPGALDSAASPWLSQEAFDEAVKAAGDRAMLLSAVGRLGVTLRLMPHTISRHLMDYDLNQTGVIPAVQSARSTKRQGIFAESVVTSVPREGWLRLDVRVGHEKEVGEPEIRPLIYGDAELPVWDETHLATCFLAPEGKTVVLGFFTDSPLEAKKEPPAKGPSWALLARVRVFNASLPLKLEGDDVPEIMDLSGFSTSFPDER